MYEVWDIGEIAMDIRKGENPKGLSLGKATGRSISDTIDWYRVELKNELKEPVTIKRLELSIPKASFDINMSIYPDFMSMEKLTDSNTNVLKPGEMRAFQFTFKPTYKPLRPQYFEIRPFIVYQTNNGQNFKQALRSAAYTPTLTIKESEKLLKVGQ